ncbi:XdhC family protein [Rhodococcus antarcticus]|uniref:XdhC family protein n=1 Tax=Rhodococcus antarcticus TaxID=2987751 RepID=A0ABY6NXU3_9NOCA|nr:XdhC family protein [Rhodococcus antarcticus]UZJ23753.1 XdhC family protein [Rhodococcus antarcticus]
MDEQMTPGAELTGATDAVCVVRVSDRSGLGSVTSGELVVRTARGSAGELLGGALDTAVAELAGEVLGGTPVAGRTVALGEDAAVAAGLACAGTVTLLAHRLDVDAAHLLGSALSGGEPAVLAAGPRGARVLVGAALERSAGSVGGTAVDERAGQLLRRGVSATEHLEVDGEDVLLDLWVPVPRVLLVGAGVLGAAIAAQAAMLGWTSETVTAVAETEAAVATLTAADVLVLLDHSPDFDGALLACARGPAFAGALGSRHTQSARRDRLTAAGASEAELDRVRGPVGLDLGARTPAETAVSVVAEVLARRGGRTPAALGATAGRIGV